MGIGENSMKVRAYGANRTFGRPSTLVAALRLIWHVVRLSLLALLMLLEPLVRTVLGLAMLLGVFAAIVFELSAAGAQFELLQQLALALGFGAALFVYYALLALLSR